MYRNLATSSRDLVWIVIGLYEVWIMIVDSSRVRTLASLKIVLSYFVLKYPCFFLSGCLVPSTLFLLLQARSVTTFPRRTQQCCKSHDRKEREKKYVLIFLLEGQTIDSKGNVLFTTFPLSVCLYELLHSLAQICAKYFIWTIYAKVINNLVILVALRQWALFFNFSSEHISIFHIL